MGTAAVAYGATRRSRPKRQFLHITARDRKSKLKAQDRTNWRSNWRAEKRKYRHYVSHMHSPQVDVQERRHKKRQSKPRTSSRLLKGAGSVMIVGGKALPTLAYGYVGYDIYRRRRSGQKVNVRHEIERTTFGMTTEDAISRASDVWSFRHAAMPILRMAWRLA